MLNWRHESLFLRFTSTRPASCRSGHPTRADCGSVAGLPIDDQTVSAAAPPDRPACCQTDPWPASQGRGGTGRRTAGAVGRARHGHPRTALPVVATDAWRARQHGDDESCHRAVGLDPQKKQVGATERSQTARAAWHGLTPYLPLDRLIFLDECGSHIGLTPLYARAPRGKRAFGLALRNRGKNTTLIAGLSLAGIQAPFILEGAVDTVAFEAYVDHILTPVLSPGQVVVLDNLSVHTGIRVRQLIEARGCQVLFLPAYSPDLTPIEEAFSKLKAFLRRVEACTREALVEAIGAGLDTITAQDAHGWFGHCGYPPQTAPG